MLPASARPKRSAACWLLRNTVVQAIDGWRDAPDAAAKKRIDQIWCSQAIAVKSTRVVFNGLQEPQVSDHAGVLIEL